MPIVGGSRGRLLRGLAAAVVAVLIAATSSAPVEALTLAARPQTPDHVTSAPNIDARNTGISTDRSKDVKQFADLTGPVAATAIAAGSLHSCALLASGSIDCWGDNTYGELGDGTTTDSATAVAVTGISGAVALSAGGADSCALLAGGSIDCWGDNTYGELGIGSTAPDSLVATTVTGWVP